MQVQLFKKLGTYTDNKDGKEKRYTNFYVKCGDALVPINVCFFPSDKFDGRDPQYAGRKEVLSAFADTLPDLPAKDKSASTKDNSVAEQPHPPASTPTPVDSSDSALDAF